MSGNPQIIRASEVGRYVYCNRAWWYMRQGIEPSNLAEMAAGSRYHHLHGLRVRAARIMAILAVTLLVIGVVLTVIVWLLGGVW